MADNLVFCTQCGAQSSGEAGFCQKCGARLAAAAAVAAPAPRGEGYPAAAAPAYPAAASPAYPAVPVLPEGYYGGFWIRVAAYLIDHVLLGIVVAPFYFLLIFPNVLKIIQQAQENSEPSPEVFASMFGAIFMFAGAAFVGNWLYEALLTSSSWQGTVGKRILRLKVTDDQGNRISFARATGRFFAKILSGMVMYVGFIMVAFMERKRGLHDVICGTQVLRY
jgi:uncharacterized RDD family membrane protein YckC